MQSTLCICWLGLIHLKDNQQKTFITLNGFCLLSKLPPNSYKKLPDIATSSFICSCFISADIILYNFSELGSKLFEIKFLSQVFLF